MFSARSDAGVAFTCCTTTAMDVGELNGTMPASIS